jgi:tetratricopeptide (TPR) repeat protein/TolB-like protein
VLKQIVIAALAVLTASTIAFSGPGTVLVFPFDNQSGDRNLDWIGEGISELIIDRLQSEPAVYAFQREERLSGFEKLGIPETASISRATAVKLGWDRGADRVITGRFVQDAQGFSVYARILDLVTSGASDEIKIAGKLEDVIPLTNTLSWQILKEIVPATRVPESDYTSHPPVPRSAFEDYIRAIVTNDPQRRSQLLDDAVRLHPLYFAALFDLGRLQHFDGDFKASNQRLEKVATGSPDYSQAQFVIGLNDYYLGDYAQAATVFSGLPATYDVLVNLGSTLWDKGDAAGAASAWKRAVERDPFAVEAVFNLGYSSFNKGDIDSAVRNLEQTLRLEGRDAEAMFLLSRAYERAGKIDDGQRLLAQAVRISPRLERWTVQPIPKLVRLRQTPDLTALRVAGAPTLWSPERLQRKAKAEDLAAWVEFVQTQAGSQLYGDALRELKELLSVFPHSSEGYVLMGQIHEHQKTYEQAAADYEKAIAIHPAPETFVMLAKTYRAMNQPARALSAVQEALKLDPRNVAALALKADLEKTPRRNRE